MTNATHTPGPWHICDVTARSLRLIRDEKGYCVAEAVKPANSSASYIDAGANARLIAAAPELLAALEYFAAQADEDTPCEYRSEHFNDALAEARAAIAKARGE